MTPEALQAFIATIPAMPIEKMVKLFVKTREAKAAATKEADARDAEFKSIMSACENHMLAAADKQGVTGFTTPFGTTYTAETTKISIADDSAFFDFVRASGDLDFFERRVSSKHVENYMKAKTETIELAGAEATDVTPPGLNLFRERVMRVRKAAEK